MKKMDDDERVQFISDLKRVAKTDPGANVIRRLAQYCLEGQNPYVPGQFDQTANNCGKLGVILWIRKMLKADGLPRQDKAITEKVED
jgi:hypothetical protein